MEEEDLAEGRIMLTIIPEFGSPRTAPADYFLENWGNHRAARKAIEMAMKGKSGTFETPAGLNIIRKARSGERMRSESVDEATGLEEARYTGNTWDEKKKWILQAQKAKAIPFGPDLSLIHI